MSHSMFARFSPVIRSLSEPALVQDVPDRRLLLAEEGGVHVYYAPFDWTNPAARVVVVGLTPGRTQMVNGLREARNQLVAGADDEAACRAAKKTAGFSGAMRPNLVALLDRIGVQKWLGIGSSAQLFAGSADLVQTTSILRFPVFVNAQNYSGTPDPLGNALLRRFVLEHF